MHSHTNHCSPPVPPTFPNMESSSFLQRSREKNPRTSSSSLLGNHHVFLASCFSSGCLDFLWCRCEFWDKQLLLHSSNSLFWHSVRGQRNRTGGNVGNVEGCLAREFSRRPALPTSGPGTVLFCFWNFNVFRGIWDKSQRFELTRPVVS